MSIITYGSKILAITGTGIMAGTFDPRCPMSILEAESSPPSGYSIGGSFNSIPALLAADMPAPHLVKAWDTLFETGKATIVPAIIVCAASFYLAAYY